MAQITFFPANDGIFSSKFVFLKSVLFPYIIYVYTYYIRERQWPINPERMLHNFAPPSFFNSRLLAYTSELHTFHGLPQFWKNRTAVATFALRSLSFALNVIEWIRCQNMQEKVCRRLGMHHEGAQQVFRVLRVELWPALPQYYAILQRAFLVWWISTRLHDITFSQRHIGKFNAQIFMSTSFGDLLQCWTRENCSNLDLHRTFLDLLEIAFFLRQLDIQLRSIYLFLFNLRFWKC